MIKNSSPFQITSSSASPLLVRRQIPASWKNLHMKYGFFLQDTHYLPEVRTLGVSRNPEQFDSSAGAGCIPKSLRLIVVPLLPDKWMEHKRTTDKIAQKVRNCLLEMRSRKPQIVVSNDRALIPVTLWQQRSSFL